jgi:hypothetical protein
MAVNAGRVFLGGLIAGVVRLVAGAAVHALVIGPLFLEEVARNQPGIAVALEATPGRIQFVVMNLLMGIATIYMYAAMRPRFASRLATVLSASVPAWLLVTATWGITAAMGLFSWPNVIVQASLTFITVVVSAYLGSSIYKDTEEVGVTSGAGVHATAGART